MNYRFYVALLAVGSFLFAFVLGGGAGTSISYENGVGGYEASTSILSMLGAVGILVAYSVALEPPPSGGGTEPLAGAGRRALAWFVDFVLSVTALSSVIALIPLTIEALQTGHFAWEFQRSQTGPSDWLVALVVIALTFAGMAFYWALPVLRGAQTVGQCILGIRVVPAGPAPLSVKRVWLRGLAQPFAPLLWLSKLVSGKYWPDMWANTKVVRVPVHSSAAA